MHEMHAQVTERGQPRLDPAVVHAIRRARPAHRPRDEQPDAGGAKQADG
jgi:hypothetical protein